jgi:prolyl oligopeptidase
MTPPTARIDMVYDTYFGTTITDPYRWLEDWEGAEARAWLDAQAACAQAFLDALPARASLLAHIAALDAAGPTVSDLRLAGGRTFYVLGATLVVRTVPDAEEQVLLDPDSMAGEEPVAVTWYAPSPNGRFVAYGLAQRGSMESTLHILDVDGGRTLDLAISRASPTVRWLDDNRSFLYHRFTATSKDAPPAQRFRNNRTYLHRPSHDPEEDRTVFGRGLPGVEIDEMTIPLIHTAPGSAWLVGEALQGVTRRSLYVAPSRQLDEPGPCRWTKVADVDDPVHGFALGGDTLYLLTDQEAPRRKVLALSLHDPDLARATVLVPESRVVIEEIRVAGDDLLTRELEGGIIRLRRVARDTGEQRAVALPSEGTVRQWASEASWSGTRSSSALPCGPLSFWRSPS